MNDKKRLSNLSGKYAKEILQRLEDQKLSTKAIRKIVLDCLNDLGREIEEITDKE